MEWHIWSIKSHFVYFHEFAHVPLDKQVTGSVATTVNNTRSLGV